MSKLFIPYIMGNKNLMKNIQLLSDNGADIIEIGIPFSDPVADGPTIMEAGCKAIKEGVNADYLFTELKKHKNEISSKYVLMTYYNIIHHYGEKAFIKACEEAGVYGVIVPDLPFELIEQMKERNMKRNVKLISLISMTASEQRIKCIAEKAEGFVYTVTMNATTGENGKFHPDLKARIQAIKNYTTLPVVAGFGIRTPDHVRDISSVSDGVVIGSEIVRQLYDNGENEVIKYLKSIRDTLNQTN
ncbi:tryptophan synthase subunit alpha [Staphylococcus sp. SQ8-PEA]|uniref:Tryptophan synthase alpha chain n=1 Tax=Staphylococcus marylandisciuri TaxID=2981529 RepID=A0ABT2QNK9_9STAP|nr:tryptophan synthase subunit alpha [Staphylococcus marylandisciuri]MCU5745561.1 tryptophan synthase subunit alpha [Staphylococcus marylandisciuri]